MPSDSNDTVRTLFKGGGVLFLGLFVELGISFLAKLVIARVLGRVDYGVVSLGITTAVITSTIVLLGLDIGLGRYLPRFDDDERRRGALVSAFQVALPLSVLAGAAVAVGAPTIAREVFHDPATTPILRVFALAIPLAALMKLSVGAVQGLKQSLPKVYIRNLALPLVRFGGVLVMLSLGFRSLGIAWAYVAAYAAAAAVGVFFLLRRTPLFDRSVRPTLMRRDLLAFSAPLVVSTTMTLVFSDIDTFMLGFFSTSGDVGVYNTVYPIAQLLTVSVASFGFIFMPVVSELHEKGESGDTRRLYRVVTKWILFGTLPLFALFALFPARAIRVTFGPEYVVGDLALAVLSIAFFTHSVAGPNSNALTSFGHTRLIMYDNTFVAATNVALNLVLIPRYSFLGAAVATAVSYVLLNLLYSAQLYRVSGIHPFSESITRPGLLAVVLVGAHYALVRTALPDSGGIDPLFWLSYLGFLVAYALVLLRTAIEEEEVMLLLSFEERFGVDLAPLKRAVARLMD